MAERSKAAGENLLLKEMGPSVETSLMSHLRAFRLTRGQALHEQGSEFGYVHFLQNGLVSLLVVMKNGQALQVAMVGSEGLVGEAARFGRPVVGTRALVTVDGVSLRMPATSFRLAVQESTAIRDIVDRYQQRLFQQVQYVAACNALHSLEQRLCRWLLQASDRIRGFSIPMTQDLLAQLLGVHRGTLNAVIRSLCRRGMLDENRGHGLVHILDRDKLMDCVCECYGMILQAQHS